MSEREADSSVGALAALLGLAAAGGLVWALWPRRASAQPTSQGGSSGGNPFSGLGGFVLHGAGAAFEELDKIARREPRVVWRWGAYQALHDTIHALLATSPSADTSDVVDAAVWYYVGRGRSPWADASWLMRNAQDDYLNLERGLVKQGWLPHGKSLEEWSAIPEVRRGIERGRRRWYREGGILQTDGRVHLPGGRYGYSTRRWLTRELAERADVRPRPSDVEVALEGYSGPPLRLYQPSSAGVDRVMGLWGMPPRSRGAGESWAAFRDRHPGEFRSAVKEVPL